MPNTTPARDLTAAAATGNLTVPIAAHYPLDQVAQAHDHVDNGSHGRILLTIPH
jgi:NADPH2:quinone reductase